MDFLSNTEWQFIISACISIISISVGIWLGYRRPVQIPISYEALAIEPVDSSKDEVKEILRRIQVSHEDSAIKHLCFVTFKIENYGRDSIKLDDKANPLTIEFEEGTSILHCQKLETEPRNVKVTIELEAEKVLLVLPLLDPKESITLRVLLTNYVNYFPDIYVRVPGKKRIVRANNVRSSNEMKILSIVCLCVAISFYLLVSFVLSSPKHPLAADFYLIAQTGRLLFFSLFFILISWSARRIPPYPFLLPSTLVKIYYQMFLCALPVLTIIGISAAIIFVLFGIRILALLFFIFISLCAPLGAWGALFSIIVTRLRKRNKAYNSIRIGIFTGIIPLLSLAYFVYVIIEIIKYW